MFATVARMETAGLRERKKQETRIALSWAAVRLAVERGLDNVRVEDIAAEAGVSLRTFRNYFSNKAEAIAPRHVDRIAADRRGVARAAGRRAARDAIRTAIETQFALGQEGSGGTEPPDEQWLAGIRLMVTEPALQGEIARATPSPSRSWPPRSPTGREPTGCIRSWSPRCSAPPRRSRAVNGCARIHLMPWPTC